jgi:hypothetical protein
LRTLIDSIGGVYELARLAVLTRCDFHGPYWTWRLHTAFGNSPINRGEAARSVLKYARWIRHQRRGG